jgi:Flp pilus assembly protein TadD
MRKSLETLKDSSKSIPPQLDAARVELEGHIEARSGKKEKGLELLSKAARMENELIYTEPPAYPRPVLEGLARTALALGNFKEAESASRKAFELEPGSGRALWGIAQALYGAGEKDEADKVFAQFARVWVTADSDLPEMNKAQENTRPSTAASQSR